MTIRFEVDSDSTDSDGGNDGEPDSDVAETTIPSEGEYAGKIYGYDGEPDSDVAETSIPSDGEYAGETDGDGAEINIGVAVGTWICVGNRTKQRNLDGRNQLNRTNQRRFDRGDIWLRLPGIGSL
jgi:hypothetical protein